MWGKFMRLKILFKKKYRVLFLIIVFLSSSWQLSFAKSGNLTILHTNDIHSHLSQFPFLSTEVKKIREEKKANSEPVLLLDSGDFMMGTLYSCLITKVSGELSLMKILNYNATTLGNHEFDFSPSFLAKAILIAKNKENGLITPIISSNIQFNPFISSDDKLKKLYDNGVIKPYLIKVLSNGLKIGIIGLLGKNADMVAVNKFPVSFNHNKDFIQRVVNEVRSKNVDLLICLSHSGVDEDKEMAKKIKGIDIIIAGHDHRSLFSPIRVRNTLIVETGCYLKYLGKLEISINKGKVSVRNYKLIPLNENIQRDRGVQKIVDEYTEIINKNILKPMGLSFSSPLAEVGFNLTKRGFLTDTNLGNLAADAIKEEVSLYQPERRVDFAFIPNALIRDEIIKGKITPSDAFQVLPFFSGLDGKCGYPLVSFYLDARQIKQILEIPIFLSRFLGNKVFFQISGLRFKYDIFHPLFNKVVKMEKWSPREKKYIPLPLDDVSLYKVATDFLTMNLLSLFVIPRDFKGNYLNIFTKKGREKTLVDINPFLKGTQELKEWKALIEYLQRLPDLNGDSLPDVPLKYAVFKRRISAPPENILKYGTKMKNPWIAAGAALIFPSLGHIYCKEKKRGVKFVFLELGSIFLIEKKSTRNLGILSFALSKIWECVDAYYTAENYNRKLAQEFHVEFSKGNFTVQLSHKF